MTVSIRFRSVAGVLLAATAMALPTGLAAQVPVPQASQDPSVPTAQELSRISPAGSYLAARHATARRDAAAAAAYYRNALKSAPRNPELLSRAFLAVLFEGDIDEATRLADRILQLDRNDRTARLVLGVRALKQKQYAVARQHLALSVGGPITDLAAALLAAWTYASPSEQATAVATIDKLSGADWYAIFKDLHAGMILDLVGNKKEAGRRLEKAYKSNSSALRVVEAYGRWASRNAPKGEATKIYESFDKVLARHPLIVSAMDQLKSAPAPGTAAPVAGPLPALTMLRTGASGDVVKRVQVSLGITANGQFDPSTTKAVKEFQRKNGLKADGVVGPATYAKLKLDVPAPVAPVTATASKPGSDELPPLVELCPGRRRRGALRHRRLARTPGRRRSRSRLSAARALSHAAASRSRCSRSRTSTRARRTTRLRSRSMSGSPRTRRCAATPTSRSPSISMPWRRRMRRSNGSRS